MQERQPHGKNRGTAPLPERADRTRRPEDDGGRSRPRREGGGGEKEARHKGLREPDLWSMQKRARALAPLGTDPKEIIRDDRHWENKGNAVDTMFLPPMYGQWKIFRKFMEPLIKDVDVVVSLGNNVSLHESAQKPLGRGKWHTDNAALSNEILSFYLPDGDSLHDRTQAPQGAREVDWVQLVGPYEIIALSDTESALLPPEVLRMLREAYFSHEEGESAIKVAYASNGRLCTHAGLTYGMWEEIGKPDTAEEAAQLLNERFSDALYFGNSLSTGCPPNLAADPVFADTVMEFLPSWLYAPVSCPFEQVSASSLNNARGNAALRSELSPLRWIDEGGVLFTRFGSVTRIKDTQFFGLDLELNREIIFEFDSFKKVWVERSF